MTSVLESAAARHTADCRCEVRSGEVTDEASFGHWLLKFDRGRDGGAIEFAYSQLAASAGIAGARASAMLDEVRSAVGGCRFVAEDVGVDDRRINAVSRTLSGVCDDLD